MPITTQDIIGCLQVVLAFAVLTGVPWGWMVSDFTPNLTQKIKTTFKITTLCAVGYGGLCGIMLGTFWLAEQCHTFFPGTC